MSSEEEGARKKGCIGFQLGQQGLCVVVCIAELTSSDLLSYYKLIVQCYADLRTLLIML